MAISNSQSHFSNNANLLTSKQLNFIPPFSGFFDSQSILDFFQRVEEVADHFGWSDSSKRLAVKLRVTGDAKHFVWKEIFNIKEYDSLKNALLERYNRKPQPAYLLQAFLLFKQPPDMPVSEFIAKATMLSFKTFYRGEASKELEEENRVTFLKYMLLINLTPEILRGVIAAKPKTLEEIKEAALLQERAWKSANFSASNETYSSPVNAVHVSVEKAQSKEDMWHQLSEKVEILTAKVTDLTRQSKQSQLCKSYTRPGHLARFNPTKHDSREVRHSFRYGQNSSQPNYSDALSPPPQHYPFYPHPENNYQQFIPTVGEVGAHQESVTRITGKAFSGYFEVSKNEVPHNLARKCEETETNRELIFRKDDESPAPQKEAVNNSIDELSESQRNKNDEKEGQKIGTDTSVCERETMFMRKYECLDEKISETENVQVSHSISEKRPVLDTGKVNDRGFSLARDAPHTLKLPSASYDDKIRGQSIEERKKSDKNKRKRRAGQIKHYGQSKRLAVEKTKAFEKYEEENNINVDRHRQNRESRDDKYFSRNYRNRDKDEGNRLQYNYPQFPFSRHVQKDIPPRFQKLRTEYFQQQVKKQTINQSGQARSMPTHIRYSIFKRRKRKDLKY